MLRYKKVITGLLIVAVAVLITGIICNYKGDKWEEVVRTALYKITHDSVANYAREIIDDKGIPFVYYREQNGIVAGNQYNPTIICNYAINYYKIIEQTNDSIVQSKFLNCVDWLANNMTDNGHYALYRFNWQQPWYDSVGAPYTSGMTSGLAMEVFSDAYKLQHSQKYLDHAQALLKGFYQPIQSGGFTYKTPNGWWYEEIADTALHTPHILDGHIFAVLGVYSYWKITKDSSAALVIQKGLESLKHNLPAYDAGNGWSLYDVYGKPTDKKYHRILSGQMLQLWNITNDPVFYNYYNKWSAPLKKPYILRALSEKNRSGIILIALLTTIIAILIFVVCKIILKKRNNHLSKKLPAFK